MILGLLEQVLIDAGYEVVTALDGQDALDKWSANAGRFDLVMLDASMPGLGGWETYQRLRALGATVPVLFSSGDSASAMPQIPTGNGAPVLLSKPYDPLTLLRTIAQVLGDAREHD